MNRAQRDLGEHLRGARLSIMHAHGRAMSATELRDTAIHAAPTRRVPVGAEQIYRGRLICSAKDWSLRSRSGSSAARYGRSPHRTAHTRNRLRGRKSRPGAHEMRGARRADSSAQPHPQRRNCAVRQGLPTRRAQRPAQPGTVCCGVSPTKSPPLTACSTGRRRKSVPLR